MEPVLVEAPPSKSVSHRVLIGAALAGGESVVEGVLESKDPERTRAVLSAAGAVFEPLGPGAYGGGGALSRARAPVSNLYPATCTSRAPPVDC